MHQTDPIFKHLIAREGIETVSPPSALPSTVASLQENMKMEATMLLTNQQRKEKNILPSSTARYCSPTASAFGKRANNTLIEAGGSTTSRQNFELFTTPLVLQQYGLENPFSADNPVLMDPIAALRQCIRYFYSHPEVYGTNLGTLLEREVRYVLQLKTAELALVGATPHSEHDALRLNSKRKAAPNLARYAKLKAKLVPPMLTLPPLHSSPRLQGPENQSDMMRGNQDGLSGYGRVTFVPACEGLYALIEKIRSHSSVTEQSMLTPQRPDTVSRPSFSGFFPADWAHHFRFDPIATEDGSGASIPPPRGGEVTTDQAQVTEKPDLMHGLCNAHASEGGLHGTLASARIRGFTRVGEASTAPHCILVDSSGYEIAFLRDQIDQLEAVYNSKCIHLCELIEENKELRTQLITSQEAVAQWKSAHQSIEAQLKISAGEVEHLRDRIKGLESVRRATSSIAPRPVLGELADLSSSNAVSTAAHSPSTEADNVVHYKNLLNEARQEVTQLNELWRETEHALQESCRNLEKSEKEANQSLDHLGDAFFYIERLERRVARRNAYIDLTARRHASLEEKYEKLMWCCQEMGALCGGNSYVDHLLANHPVWSLLLFIRLQRQAVGYCPAPFFPNASKMKNAGSGQLLFVRKPTASVLVDAVLDPSIVHAWIAREVAPTHTGEEGKQEQPKQRGVVCCRALRWRNPFSIDYFGNHSVGATQAQGGGASPATLPLLTMASLLFPLEKPNVASATLLPSPDKMQAPTGVPTTAAAPNKAASDTAPEINWTVPNSGEFDQNTIRFLLHAFWHDRLCEYKRNMQRHVNEAIQLYTQRMHTGPVKEDASSLFSTKVLGNETSVEKGFNEELLETGTLRDATNVELRPKSTFLSALVDFAMRIFEEPDSASEKQRRRGQAESAAQTRSQRLPKHRTAFTVHGVAAQVNSTTEELWRSGQFFFATVIKHRGPLEGAQKINGHEKRVVASAEATPTLSPKGTLSPSTLEEEVVAQFPPRVLEFLIALYYYTMEYKEQDADFRLFYYTSHQLIPETVGINFFASLEALEQDCHAAVLRHLRVESQTTTMQTYMNGQSSSYERCIGNPNCTHTLPQSACISHNAAIDPSDTPMEALHRVMCIIDEAPLLYEDDAMEVDSDGEGYGSVLPSIKPIGQSKEAFGRRKHNSSTSTYRKVSANGILAGGDARTTTALLAVVDDDTDRSGGNAVATPAEADTVASHQDGTHDQGTRMKQFLHNVREYLSNSSRRDHFLNSGLCSNLAQPQQQQQPEAEARAAGSILKGATVANPPPEWVDLDRRVRHALGPHASLLAALDCGWDKFSPLVATAHAPSHQTSPKNSYFKGQRARRFWSNQMRNRGLAAERGLLGLNEVIQLLKRHCFASYAVSSCGTPRFSLASVFCPPESDNPTDYKDPLSLVGQLPPTDLHLQRLRFALALDQPASLIQPTRLFAFDMRTNNPSHLYDEYLSLTLDVFCQQQEWLMEGVLQSCGARHKHCIMEGTEECNGEVPIAFLRRGCCRAFSRIGLAKSEADSFVDHLVGYDKFLSKDGPLGSDHQFMVAPWLINASELEESSVLLSSEELLGSPSTPSAGMGWNLQEEFETCSLLNIALAVRTSYLIWGSGAEEAARRCMAYLGAMPLLSSRGTPFSQHSQALRPPTPTAEGNPLDARNILPSHVTEVDDLGQRYQETQLNSLAWNVFENTMKVTYLRFINACDESGCGSAFNPLRQSLEKYIPGAAAALPKDLPLVSDAEKSVMQLYPEIDKLLTHSVLLKRIEDVAVENHSSPKRPKTASYVAFPDDHTSPFVAAIEDGATHTQSLYSLGQLMGLVATLSNFPEYNLIPNISKSKKWMKKKKQREAAACSTVHGKLTRLLQTTMTASQQVWKKRLNEIVSLDDLQKSQFFRSFLEKTPSEDAPMQLNMAHHQLIDSMSKDSLLFTAHATADMNACATVPPADPSRGSSKRRSFAVQDLRIVFNDKFERERKSSMIQKPLAKCMVVGEADEKSAGDAESKVSMLQVSQLRYACATLSLM